MIIRLSTEYCISNVKNGTGDESILEDYKRRHDIHYPDMLMKESDIKEKL